jgi:hypothetical protein
MRRDSPRRDCHRPALKTGQTLAPWPKCDRGVTVRNVPLHGAVRERASPGREVTRRDGRELAGIPAGQGTCQGS